MDLINMYKTIFFIYFVRDSAKNVFFVDWPLRGGGLKKNDSLP